MAKFYCLTFLQKLIGDLTFIRVCYKVAKPRREQFTIDTRKFHGQEAIRNRTHDKTKVTWWFCEMTVFDAKEVRQGAEKSIKF